MNKTFLSKVLLRAKLTWIFIALSPIFLFLIFTFQNSSQAQFKLLALAALVYFLVAIGHHLKDQSLKFEIVVEYFLIALLSLIILQGFLS